MNELESPLVVGADGFVLSQVDQCPFDQRAFGALHGSLDGGADVQDDSNVFHAIGRYVDIRRGITLFRCGQFIGVIPFLQSAQAKSPVCVCHRRIPVAPPAHSVLPLDPDRDDGIGQRSSLLVHHCTGYDFFGRQFYRLRGVLSRLGSRVQITPPHLPDVSFGPDLVLGAPVIQAGHGGLSLSVRNTPHGLRAIEYKFGAHDGFPGVAIDYRQFERSARHQDEIHGLLRLGVDLDVVFRKTPRERRVFLCLEVILTCRQTLKGVAAVVPALHFSLKLSSPVSGHQRPRHGTALRVQHASGDLAIADARIGPIS